MIDALKESSDKHSYYFAADFVLVDDWLFNIPSSTATQLSDSALQCIRAAVRGDSVKDRDILRELVQSHVLTEVAPFQTWSQNKLNVYFELTLECNSECRYCFNRTFSRRSQLSLIEWKELISRIPKGSSITLFGGEPTLYPELRKLIEMIDSKGLSIILFSNCLEVQDALLDLLAGTRDCCIKTSIDGPSFVHDSIRGVGNYTRVSDTIYRIRMRGVPVIVKTLKTRALLRKISLLMEKLASLDVTQVGFGDLILQGKFSGYLTERPTPQEDYELFTEAINASKQFSLPILDLNDHCFPMINMCGCGDNLVYIRSDGGISGCTIMSDDFARFDYTAPEPDKSNWMSAVPYDFRQLSALAPVCRSCGLVNLCFGGCRGRAFVEQGSMLACDLFRRNKILYTLRLGLERQY